MNESKKRTASTIALFSVDLLLLATSVSVLLYRFDNNVGPWYEPLNALCFGGLIGLWCVLCGWHAFSNNNPARQWLNACFAVVSISMVMTCCYFRFGASHLWEYRGRVLYRTRLMDESAVILGTSMIVLVGSLLLSRIIWWSLQMAGLSLNKEERNTRFQIANLFWFLAAIALLMSLIRSFTDSWLAIAIPAGIFVAVLPIAISANRLGHRRTSFRLGQLMLVISFAVVLECLVAWNLPVTWPIFVKGSVFFNVAVASIVFANSWTYVKLAATL